MNAQTPNLPVRVTSSALMDPDAFNHMQRVAQVLALSPLFPEHLRKGTKETAIANGVLVMNMAMRQQEDPLTVAQNIYFVGGKPGWATTYMIAKANQHGVFKDQIDWKVTGKGDDLSVTAFAVLSGTGREVGVTCDMVMAKKEGWTKNSKYQSIPEQMLRYRSAAFLIRLYCPEVMIGVPSMIELETSDYRDITPPDTGFKHLNPDDEAKEEVESAENVTDSKPTPQADPKPAQKPREAVAYTEAEEVTQEQAKPVQKAAEAEANPEATTEADAVASFEKHNKTFNRIMDQLLSGALVDDVRANFAADLAAMEQQEPGLREKIEAELAEFKAQEA